MSLELEVFPKKLNCETSEDNGVVCFVIKNIPSCEKVSVGILLKIVQLVVTEKHILI